MVQWRIDGEYTQSDISQEDALPVNDVSVADRDTVELRISEANPSTEVKLRIFDQLGDNGYPLSGDIGRPYDCAIDGTGVCAMSLNEDGSGVVTLHPAEHGQGLMYVVQAFYPSLEDVDMDANVTDYSISWAMRDAAR